AGRAVLGLGRARAPPARLPPPVEHSACSVNSAGGGRALSPRPLFQPWTKSRRPADPGGETLRSIGFVLALQPVGVDQNEGFDRALPARGLPAALGQPLRRLEVQRILRRRQSRLADRLAADRHPG